MVRSLRSRDGTLRETVRFYPLDHRTAVGKAIDIGLLFLNLLFVVVFVVETYPHSAATDA
jgi:voltage-gated potassium channel